MKSRSSRRQRAGQNGYDLGETQVHALRGVAGGDAGRVRDAHRAIGSKSTFMHLLGCLDRPSSGDYLLDGNNVAVMDKRALARVRNTTIGLVPGIQPAAAHQRGRERRAAADVCGREERA